MKKFLIIVLAVLAVLFVIGLFVPDTQKNQSKKENAVSENKSIEYSSDWFKTKEKKKEKLIEKKIVGDWYRTFSIRYDQNEFDKEIYQINQGNYYQEKFTKGMLPKYSYEFSSKQGVKKNENPLAYSIDNTTLTIVNPLQDNEHENVLFIGNGLMVRNSEINSVKLGGYDFYKNVDATEKDYQNELVDFLNSLLIDGAEQVKEAASLINQGRQSEGFAKLTQGVSFLRIVSLSDTALKSSVSELITGIKSEFSSNFDTYVETQINSLKQEIATSKTEDWKIEYLDKFSQRLSYINNLKFISSTIGANTSKIDNAYKEVEKAFDTETKNLKLYGDGEQGMMKYAALDYIKMIAKNPKSIDVIRSGVSRKTSNGIVYTVVFRGQNSFGGYSIETVSVLLNYDISSRTYFVVRQV